MNSVEMLLCLLQVLPPAGSATLDLTRKGHVLIVPDVYLNRQGPFRMMIDTGNASSLIRPQVAERLGVTPVYRVAWSTAAGEQTVPGILLDEVRTGSVTRATVEALVIDGLAGGVDGVLGQSWLIHSDYLIDYRHRRLVIGGDPPAGGARHPLRYVEGRPAIHAEVDGRPAELVLDSGAGRLVLFGSSRGIRYVTLFTNGGATDAQVWPARITIPGERERILEAVRVQGPAQAGLLPLDIYSWVWISNREGVVMLGR
jgi:predicted aspartyl protease